MINIAHSELIHMHISSVTCDTLKKNPASLALKYEPSTSFFSFFPMSSTPSLDNDVLDVIYYFFQIKLENVPKHHHPLKDNFCIHLLNLRKGKKKEFY